MDATRRSELARAALAGYASGPAATVKATARALARVDSARAILLVEGVSDQIAVETAAAGRGRDLDAERIVVLPIGGAHAVGRVLTRLAPLRDRVRLAGLCDRGEAELFRRGLAAGAARSVAERSGAESSGSAPAGIDRFGHDGDLARLGCYVCVEDLEDELIRAVGPAGVEALFAAQGDLASFRAMRNQPAWRDRRTEAQMRRFLGSGSNRKLRYAKLLVQAAIDRDALPRPLDALLNAV